MKLFASTQSLRDRQWPGYLIGILAVAASFGVRVALGDAALKFPFVIFLPPVVLTAFFGGVRPGIATAIAAGLVANYTLIAPIGSLWPAWPEGWLALAFYGVTVGIDIALIHGMTTSARRASVAEAALRQVNEALETRVTERTAALSQQILEREAAEAQVRQMQKIESVGQLTGGIAHDFNNMLAVIVGSLDMARRRLNDPEKLAEFIGNAENGARRASDLVARLLAFSRRQALEPRVLDVNQLVGGMSDLLRRAIGETVRVETTLAGDLWRCFADAVQVENAVLNLAVNARDAMPEGGRLAIETSNCAFAPGNPRRPPDVALGAYVMIVVADTGVGMPPHVIERAFDPFFTTKGLGRGTGLGLSQVYGFVKQSGGHITIASKIGSGTTITLYLPRHDGLDMPAIAPTGAAKVPLARADEIVMVVEDEPGVRDISVDTLRELGYIVVETRDANDALSILASPADVHLLFTDVIMPEMNGRQLADAARVLRPDLKVLYTSGYARDTVLEGAIGAVPLPLLPKPFTLSQLATKIRATLDDDTAVLGVGFGAGAGLIHSRSP